MATSDDGETAATPSTSQSDQLGERSCVLETLLWVGGSAELAGRAGLRYIIVDDFEQAIDCCQRRLLADLVAPALSQESEGPEEGAALARWSRARARFAPDELAVRWRAAHRELAALRQEVAEAGYAPARSERLRAIVQRYGLDFELGAVYALPDDLAALLARVGDPFVWWDDAIERAEQERAPFDYGNPAHRAALARRVREANENDDYLDDGGGVFGAGSASEDASPAAGDKVSG